MNKLFGFAIWLNHYKRDLFKVLCVYIFETASGCATSSQELLWQRQAQARPRAASLGSDDFYYETPYRTDENKVPPDEFFFKKCRIKEKRSYPSRHLWECEGGF
jgi:hypothetical protein